MEIGDRIRFLRRKASMNQSELAKILGVSTSTVGFWEIGKRTPDVKLLVKIAEVFNVTTDYLLNHYNDNTIAIIEKGGLYKNIIVPEQHIKLIEDFIKSLKN